jgi:hypothetical protein
VADALQSTQRRFDAAYNAIHGEMEETVAVAMWSTREKRIASGVFVLMTVCV